MTYMPRRSEGMALTSWCESLTSLSTKRGRGVASLGSQLTRANGAHVGRSSRNEPWAHSFSLLLSTDRCDKAPHGPPQSKIVQLLSDDFGAQDSSRDGPPALVDNVSTQRRVWLKRPGIRSR